MGPFGHDSPARQRGHLRPVESCEHVPEPGTVKSERTGEPTSLMKQDAYPVRAVCKICKREIRLWSFYQLSWQPVDV
jgi:hypothetical protein